MHYLITGGAGFIGSHVTEELLAAGHWVTVVDNLTTGRRHNLPDHSRLQLVVKDVLTCQPEDFASPIDGIAHLAAIPSVNASWLQPLETHHQNLSSTLAVVQLCRALKIPRLVFASSAAVYGNPMRRLIDEGHPTAPISPYGLQKLGSEQYAHLFVQNSDFSFVGLRLFNVFGPRQRADSPYSGVISLFATAMSRDLPITIYGNGTQTRDFIYVKDVAASFVKALRADLEPGSSLICNLGTGKATSLLELVNYLRTCLPQWQGKLTFGSSRPGDIEHSQADISRASSQLGFQPQYSVISGLQRLLNPVSSQSERGSELLKS